jgi:alkaline phosphatase D
MDFWQVPENSPRRTHPGIYGAHRFDFDNKALQIILLDTRTFRDSLKRNKKPIADDSEFKNDYQPDPDESKTLLGDEQWKWLEAQLREPADVRIICSSIQFGHEYNGWESWTNLPNEQDKMVRLIRETRAAGTMFISGDVHWGEISQRNFENLFPLFDVTASGLTEEWYNVEPSKHRVGEAVRENHFGMIEIDWTASAPSISMSIVDGAGTIRTNHVVPLSELQMPEQ